MYIQLIINYLFWKMRAGTFVVIKQAVIKHFTYN